MATEHYLQIMGYGEWLERYLNDKIMSSEYSSLFIDAFKLLNIELVETSKNQLLNFYEWLEYLDNKKKYPGLSFIDNTCHAAREIFNQELKGDLFTNRAVTFVGFVGSPSSVTGEVKRDTYEINYEALSDWGFPQQDRKKMDIHCLQSIFAIINMRFHVLALFSKINNDAEPYGYTLNRLQSSKQYSHIIEFFLDSATEIKEKFIIDDTGIVPVCTISLNDRAPENEFIACAALLFIRFLMLGGQDYFGFCEHCGRFYLVQRKDRKKYCSHNCRSLASLTKHGKIKPKQEK